MENKNKNLLNENLKTNAANELQKDSDQRFTKRILENCYGIAPTNNHPINNKIENEINPYNKPQVSNNNNQISQINTIIDCIPFPPKI
jgi:hypothetical protein